MRLEDVDSDDDLAAALRLFDGELQRVGVYDAHSERLDRVPQWSQDR